MEGVAQSDQSAGRRLGPRLSWLRDWAAPLAERSPYPGSPAADRRFSGGVRAPTGARSCPCSSMPVFFGKVALDRFDAFQQPSFDLGIFDQGLWLLSRFKSPFVSVMGLNLFGDHASYILLAAGPRLLDLAGSPGPPDRTDPRPVSGRHSPVPSRARCVAAMPGSALLPALAFLLNPALGWLNLENFHPDSFEVPLVLFALYLMTERRWRAYLVMVCSVVGQRRCRSPRGPSRHLRGFRHDRRMGSVTAVLGAIWFIATVFFLGPFFSGAPAGSLDSFRVPFGGWKGLISTALGRPGRWAATC